MDAFLDRNLGGEQHDGQMAIGHILLQSAAQLVAIHAHHHHVAHNEVGRGSRKPGNGLDGAALGDHLVGRLEDEAKEAQHLRIVIDHEDCRSVVIGRQG